MADPIYTPPKTGIIYKITNTINGKFYIGQSVNFKKRWSKHRRDARCGCHYRLHRSMRKHGVDNFIIEFIEENIPQIILNDREKLWIATLIPHYNMTDGGGGVVGWKPTEEQRCKMSTAQIGRVHSEETRRSISIANKGKVNSAEARSKMSIAATGRFCSAETRRVMSIARVGRIPSAESVQKMSRSQSGHVCSEETRNRISNSQSKIWWEVTTPSGESLVIRNLQQFGRDRGFNAGKLGTIGHAHGFTAKKLHAVD